MAKWIRPCPLSTKCVDCSHYKVCGLILNPLHGGLICDDFEDKEELEFTRQYIHDQDLVWDLLSKWKERKYHNE